MKFRVRVDYRYTVCKLLLCLRQFSLVSLWCCLGLLSPRLHELLRRRRARQRGAMHGADVCDVGRLSSKQQHWGAAATVGRMQRLSQGCDVGRGGPHRQVTVAALGQGVCGPARPAVWQERRRQGGRWEGGGSRASAFAPTLTGNPLRVLRTLRTPLTGRGGHGPSWRRAAAGCRMSRPPGAARAAPPHQTRPPWPAPHRRPPMRPPGRWRAAAAQHRDRARAQQPRPPRRRLHSVPCRAGGLLPLPQPPAVDSLSPARQSAVTGCLAPRQAAPPRQATALEMCRP